MNIQAGSSTLLDIYTEMEALLPANYHATFTSPIASWPCQPGASPGAMRGAAQGDTLVWHLIKEEQCHHPAVMHV